MIPVQSTTVSHGGIVSAKISQLINVDSNYTVCTIYHHGAIEATPGDVCIAW